MIFSYFLAVAFATAALLWLAHREKQHRVIALRVAVAVPVLAVVFYLVFLSGSSRELAPTRDEDRRAAFMNVMEKKEEAFSKKLGLGAGEKITTEDVPDLMELTYAQMQQMEYDSADKVLQSALKDLPGNADITRQLAIVRFSKGLYLGEQKQFTAAVESLNAAKTVMPKDAPFAKNLDTFIQIMQRQAQASKKK